METRRFEDDTGAARFRAGAHARTAWSSVCAGTAHREAASGARALGAAVPLRERSPSATNRGRYQSGQMGQTVNLVALPSAVRIRLSPPPRATRPRFPRNTRQRASNGAPRASACSSAACCARASFGGRSSMVEPQPSKLMAWVRFPSPAPTARASSSSSTDAGTRRAARRRFAHRARGSASWSARSAGCCSSVVEHLLGKEEVMGSSPISSSIRSDRRPTQASSRLAASRAHDPHTHTSIQRPDVAHSLARGCLALPNLS